MGIYSIIRAMAAVLLAGGTTLQNALVDLQSNLNAEVQQEEQTTQDPPPLLFKIQREAMEHYISHQYAIQELTDEEIEQSWLRYEPIDNNWFEVRLAKQLEEEGVSFDPKNDTLVFYEVSLPHIDPYPTCIYIWTKDSKWEFAINVEYARTDKMEGIPWGSDYDFDQYTIELKRCEPKQHHRFIDPMYRGDLEGAKKEILEMKKEIVLDAPVYSALRIVIKDGKIVYPSHSWFIGYL